MGLITLIIIVTTMYLFTVDYKKNECKLTNQTIKTIPIILKWYVYILFWQISLTVFIITKVIQDCKKTDKETSN